MESNISSEGLQPILLQSGIHNQTFRTSEMHFENIGFAACLTCLTAIGVNSNLFMVDLILFFVFILKQLWSLICLLQIYLLIKKSIHIDQLIRALLVFESTCKIMSCLTCLGKIGLFSCGGYSKPIIEFSNFLYTTGDHTAPCWLLASLQHYLACLFALCNCITGLFRSGQVSNWQVSHLL